LEIQFLLNENKDAVRVGILTCRAEPKYKLVVHIQDMVITVSYNSCLKLIPSMVSE